jgi:hypothetical protein
VAEAVARLESAGLRLRVVPELPSGDVEGGAFLTRTRKTLDDLRLLTRNGHRPGDWAGTVYVGRCAWPRLAESPDECSFGLGDLEFFGDPDLVRQLHRLLTGG